MFGLFLIIIGIILILQKMEIIPGDFWDYVFPVIIIIFGIVLMDRSRHKRRGDKNRVINGQ